MAVLSCDPQEVQGIKTAFQKDPLNVGLGILHIPTGRIVLAPFDSVPGGHADLVFRENMSLNDCKGFVISQKNRRHLNCFE